MASAAPNTGLPLLYNQLEPVSSQQRHVRRIAAGQAPGAVPMDAPCTVGRVWPVLVWKPGPSKR